ncbi:RagB/SusD family nutrient uptake outer membrane protein [Fulvivirgaceae bacterium BMA12]|uniref:RagB/SusD family nutrient uptake outer membrane protein n=1 Tax=Agaribacillus aureus TaxID=3051825 RepID=A0ABT8L9E4_9BACT|nr:RagB/SusD family nutrient uptake outer membrane protein [Fulvivirgaceae bacterium BMA12]
MRKIYILLTASLILFGSCEDYLDRKDENSDFLSEEDVWRDKNKINSIAFRLYDCTEWWFETRYTYQRRQSAGTGKNYANTCQFSGEVITTRSLGGSDAVMRGDWWEAVNRHTFANPDFHMAWEDMWEAVYVSNTILDQIDNVPLDVMTNDERNQVKGEAHLFRALAYHEISKRWGAMPYFKEKIFPETDLNRVRPTYLEQINDIVADCDSAIMFLPEVSYLNHASMMGRMGKAAAMGLKSRALTTAASPNYTPNNGSDPDLWERAAVAAWELIQLSRTSDKVGLYDGEYTHIFHTEPGTIEGVWPRYFATERPNLYTLSWMWQGVDGYHGLSPTQEMIDLFETADGWPITHPSSGYSDQDPYTNRDPRFYEDILYHGSTWSKTTENQTMDMRTEPLGADRTTPNGSDFGNSKTGYLVRKLIPDRWNRKKYDVPKYVNAPYIRMAEIYLNYAEAVNEAYGNPQAMAPGADITAVDALNAIRNRVGHVNVRPEFTTDYQLFQDRVRNEFQVELCFEYHIWFDLIRWRTAREKLDNHNFHGVRIIEDATAPTGVRFERFEIPWERRFEDRHYRYPLRQSDLEIFELPKLVQNPGW